MERALADMQMVDVEGLANCWQAIARDDQLRPEGVDKFMMMHGRGGGKTRGGSEDTLDIQEDWGPAYRGLLASKAYQRDVEGVMVFGESGIVACAERRGYKVEYVRSKQILRYPHGGFSLLVGADARDALRGPQFNHAWADEIAKWHDPLYAWRNIKLCMRLKTQGGPVRYTITTTPRRNSPIIHHLVRKERGLHIARGTTRDNIENLDAEAVADMESDMLGTAFGRQELGGEFIEGSGTMTTMSIIDASRVRQAPKLGRRIVSFDPAITDNDDSDDHGIVVCGLDRNDSSIGYLLADLTLSSAKPEAAADAVVQASIDWSADAIIVEINQGGKWIPSMLRIAMEKAGVSVPIQSVWATASKAIRAEPIGALYELSRCRHAGVFGPLEKEATEWIPGMPSPNRMDALVHGFTHLLDPNDGKKSLTRYDTP